MSDLPKREGFVPRHAVTHEMTPDGPKIVADQVVTVPTGDETVSLPRGEVVMAGPVIIAEDGKLHPAPGAEVAAEPVAPEAAPEPAAEPEPVFSRRRGATPPEE